MNRSIDANIAEAAARQHGIVTRAQLAIAGLANDRIRSRVRAGSLLPVHRDVYLLGNLIGPLRPDCYREMAAVLASGRGAAVSHRNALWLRGLTPGRPAGPVHLTL